MRARVMNGRTPAQNAAVLGEAGTARRPRRRRVIGEQAKAWLLHPRAWPRAVRRIALLIAPAALVLWVAAIALAVMLSCLHGALRGIANIWNAPARRPYRYGYYGYDGAGEDALSLALRAARQAEPEAVAPPPKPRLVQTVEPEVTVPAAVPASSSDEAWRAALEAAMRAPVSDQLLLGQMQSFGALSHGPVDLGGGAAPEAPPPDSRAAEPRFVRPPALRRPRPTGSSFAPDRGALRAGAGC